MLRKEKLVGAIVYYDGQHNDARMNIALAFTAIRMGAHVANYCAVMELIHSNVQGKQVVRGVKCYDRYESKTSEEFDWREYDFLDKEFTIRAKCVVNATGPYTDSIRQLDDPSMPMICQPSLGVHITLPDYYSPVNMGLIDPCTSDGRVIFFLPWQKQTIAGRRDFLSIVLRQLDNVRYDGYGLCCHGLSLTINR